MISQLAQATSILKTQRTNLPVLVELTGLPKAGKTMAMNRIKRGLSQLGFNTKIVPEAATERVDKKFRSDLFAFNLQCMLINLQEVIKAMSEGDKYDTIIFDRGLFDSVVWIDFLSEIGLVSQDIAETLEKFCNHPAWNDDISHVFLLTTDWETYQYRFSLDSPVKAESGLSEDYFSTLTKCYQRKVIEFSSGGRSKLTKLTTYDCSLKEPSGRSALETSWGRTHEIAEDMIQKIISTVVEGTLESIATLPAREYADNINIPMDSESLSNFIRDVFLRTESGKLRDQNKAKGYGTPVKWVERRKAEQDDSLLQLIASAYFTNNDEYLVLQRSENEARKELKKKLTIIVGGHIDEIDRRDRWGGANEVHNCLLREIREELAHVDMPKIVPRFAIRQSDTSMGKRHMALVHEVQTFNRRIQPLQTPGAGDYESDPAFQSLPWLIQNITRFDGWSQAIINKLADDVQ